MVLGLYWCLTNDENEDEEEESLQKTVTVTKGGHCIQNRRMGDKIREFMEKLEEKLRYNALYISTGS